MECDIRPVYKGIYVQYPTLSEAHKELIRKEFVNKYTVHGTDRFLLAVIGAIVAVITYLLLS